MSSDQFSDDQAPLRHKRELQTVHAMVSMYCRHQHGTPGASLCVACDRLFDYARRRLEHCPFGDAKPTCANCTVRCYSAERRGQIRLVMKWAGPRMLLSHPVLAIFHLLDGRRPAPVLGNPSTTAALSSDSDRASVRDTTKPAAE